MEEININDKTNQEINLKELLGLVMADVDNFLLKEDNHITDKDCVFKLEEIRTQLHNTMSKFMSLYSEDFSPIYSAPIYPAIKIYLFFNNPLISKEEKLKQLKNMLDNDGYLKLINNNLK